MRKYLLIISLLGALACEGVNQQAAEEKIKEIVDGESQRLTKVEISFDLSVPESDSLWIDSLWILTVFKLSTALESETTEVYMDQELKNDSLVPTGDSALVQLSRRYTGTLTSTIKSTADETSKTVSRTFSTERIQLARFANDKDWEMVGYSIAEERSDTNTTQIFSLALQDGDLDTIIYYTSSLAGLDKFPKLSSGTKLAITLRTVADTSILVCFALGENAVLFIPQEDKEDRWNAEVTLADSPLMVGIIRKKALSDSDYPCDFDIWIIPTE